MMAKPMAVGLPLTLLICDLALSPRSGRSSGAPATILVLEKAPIFAMAAAVGVLTLLAQREIGALKTLEQVPLGIRAANAPLAVVRYLGKTLRPGGLAVHYPYDLSPAPCAVLGAIGLLAVVTALCLAAWQRLPSLLAGWIWYLATLLPVIGFLQVGSQAHADRYTYIPSVGLAVMMATLPSLWRERTDHVSRADGKPHLSTTGDGRSRLTGIAWALVGSAVVLPLCLASRSQARTWRDTTTLFRQAVSVCPDDALSRYNLARALEVGGKRGEAVRHYEAALRLRPGFREAHYRIGLALLDAGDLAGAVSHFEAEIRRDRNHAGALRALGLARWRMGETREALERFESAIRVDPLDAVSWCGAARARASLGDAGGALGPYERALSLDPADHECRYDFATALVASGRPDDARAECERVLRSAPGHEGHEGARRLLEELGPRSSSAPASDGHPAGSEIAQPR
jgi:tetratricopeptide (TPR) repeat protein